MILSALLVHFWVFHRQWELVTLLFSTVSTPLVSSLLDIAIEMLEVRRRQVEKVPTKDMPRLWRVVTLRMIITKEKSPSGTQRLMYIRPKKGSESCPKKSICSGAGISAPYAVVRGDWPVAASPS